MQDDSGKELDTGDASKKRKTKGLNHSDSGKPSEKRGVVVPESEKRKAPKRKEDTLKVAGEKQKIRSSLQKMLSACLTNYI